MAVTDDNKVKIVKAGALPHYVELLHAGDKATFKDQTAERKESEQRLAAHGLWLLAFTSKDDISKQKGCLEG